MECQDPRPLGYWFVFCWLLQQDNLITVAEVRCELDLCFILQDTL